MRAVRCRQAVAAFVATVTLLAACNGDGSSSPTTVPPSTTTTISQVELDREKARRSILTAADVPGFTEDAPDEDTDDADLEAAANACFDNNPLLVRLGEENDPRGASARDFSRGDELTLGSGVTFAETEEEARAALAAVSAAAFAACFSNALGAELRKDPTFTNVSANTARLPNLAVGDEAIGYRSTARVRVRGRSLTFYFDFTFVRVGRGVAVFSSFAVGTPFPEAERTRLVTAIAGRMAAP